MARRSDLSNKQMVATVTSQLADGLKTTDQSYLPGKFKGWCCQHTLYQRVMLPLKMSDITASAALQMDAKANNLICKWLGLPLCLPNVAPWQKHAISLGYQQEKVRLPTQRLNRSDR